MASSKQRPKKHTEYHKDGSVWTVGQTLNGVPVGYWEWFRKEGTKMRSGSFDEAGKQIGQWITYDRQGAVHKVTDMSRKRTPRAKS